MWIRRTMLRVCSFAYIIYAIIISRERVNASRLLLILLIGPTTYSLIETGDRRVAQLEPTCSTCCVVGGAPVCEGSPSLSCN